MDRREELQDSPGCAVRQDALRSVRPCGRPSCGNDDDGTTLMSKIIDDCEYIRNRQKIYIKFRSREGT